MDAVLLSCALGGLLSEQGPAGYRMQAVFVSCAHVVCKCADLYCLVLPVPAAVALLMLSCVRTYKCVQWCAGSHEALRSAPCGDQRRWVREGWVRIYEPFCPQLSHIALAQYAHGLRHVSVYETTTHRAPAAVDNSGLAKAMCNSQHSDTTLLLFLLL